MLDVVPIACAFLAEILLAIGCATAVLAFVLLDRVLGIGLLRALEAWAPATLCVLILVAVNFPSVICAEIIETLV